jgi:hypothetical protein
MVDGKCKICGKSTKLSYEHVPPKKAFNWWKQKTYVGGELIKHIQSDDYPWDVKNLKGKEQQRGAGGFAICENCNNFTGKWYVLSFIDFSKQALECIVKQQKISGSLTIEFNNVKPLNIMKQIICMFLSINNPNFSDIHPELRKFILDRENKVELKDIQIYSYINLGVVLRSIGIAGIVYPEKGYSRTVSELTTIPFGFVMEIKPPKEEKELTNISYFSSDFSYDESRNVKIALPLLQSNSYFPLDYRSMEEIKDNRG